MGPTLNSRHEHANDQAARPGRCGDGSFDAKDDRRVVESDDEGPDPVDDDFNYRVS